MNQVQVGNHVIGTNEDIFIIAEIGLNHNQDLALALELIQMAADAGCSAAKFQTFTADQVYVNDPRTGNYKLMGKEIPIYSLHKSLEMPKSWVPILKEKCETLGIEFFSAPIGLESLDILIQNQVKLIKISSYECTNTPFLKIVAEHRIPTIMSTGACNLKEIENAVNIFRNANCPLVLLHCLTKYPAEMQSANLSVMDTLRKAFDVPVGFSDNGFVNNKSEIDFLEIPTEAAKSGAEVFEIHITKNRNLPGPDHGFATEPHELAKMVSEMKKIRNEIKNGKSFELNPKIQGTSRKYTLPEEEYVRNFAFKCIFASRDIVAGEKLSSENMAVLRPGECDRGIEPDLFDTLQSYGYAKRAIAKNSPIKWQHIL